MTVANATELVVLIENMLGWTPEPTDDKPLWRLRRIEAGKINRKIKTNPRLYTWDNLELAVAHLAERQQGVRAPLGVFYHVEDALRRAPEPNVVCPTEVLIDEAIRIEREGQRPGCEEWISRLVRAFGSYRQAAYDEWARDRRCS